MSSRKLSKPLQAALWGAAMLTALALLMPEPAAVRGLPADRSRRSEQVGARIRPQTPWVRSIEPASSADSARQDGAAPLPLPEAAAPEAPPPPAAEPPPKPTAPDLLLTYLGRLEQDGRIYAFLGRGAIPQVVEVGDMADTRWRVEKADAAGVELRYLPLNETRVIAMPTAPMPTVP